MQRYKENRLLIYLLCCYVGKGATGEGKCCN